MTIMMYIFISLIIGLLGINKRIGFWGHFLLSLALTPFIGLVILAVSAPKTKTA